MNSDLHNNDGHEITEKTEVNEIKPLQEAQDGQQLSQPTKKELRHDILASCLALAAFIISVNVLVVIIAAIAVAVDSGIQDIIFNLYQNGGSLISVTNNMEYYQAVEQVVARVMGPASMVASVLGMLWMLTIRKKKLFTTDITTVNSKVKPAIIGKIFVLIWGVQFISAMINMTLNPLLEKSGLSLTDAMEQGMGVLFSTPLGIIATVLILPIVEEIVFRGAILRKLERYGANFAIIVSSLLFALYHMILLQAFFAFFVGLLLAYTAKRFSLKWSMLLHILNNGIAAFIATRGVSEIAELGVMILCAVGSVIIIYIDRREFSLIRYQGAPNISHPYKIAFTHPMFILSGVVLLGIGFLTLAIDIIG